MRAEYCGREDGHAAQRVCDIIFKGAPSSSAYRSFDSEKKRIIVFGCRFDHEPQTFELINLSQKIDYSICDLTVVLAAGVNPERERHVRMLDPRTRVLYSFGHWVTTFWEYQIRERNRTLPPEERCSEREIGRSRSIFEAERVRLTGEISYDVALCFTDAMSDWTYMMSIADFDKRIMWLPDSTIESAERLPAEFIRERFDRVLYAEEVADSRLVRRIRELEQHEGVDESGSVARSTERFIGLDIAVASLQAEESAQLGERISAALRERWDPAKAAGYLEATAHLKQIIDREMAALADATKAQAVGYYRSCGLDHIAHNRMVMEKFYDEIGVDSGPALLRASGE
jgi:hypothetical protein